MHEELDRRLCEAFPRLYVARNWPATKTCMCWGFPQDGWFNLLYELSAHLERIISGLPPARLCLCGHAHESTCAEPTARYRRVGDRLEDVTEPCGCEEYRPDNARAAQVKEKFGGLRFYLDGANWGDGDWELAEQYIRLAEARAARTCEYCGREGEGVELRKGGWLKTLCAACQENRREIEARLWDERVLARLEGDDATCPKSK